MFVSNAIAAECKARGIRQVLSPTIDLARDLRWGRVEETYGEDPCLTAKTAVSFCKSFENTGIVTTPKHFVANSGDGGRDSGPVYHSERILKKLYFVPYKACIEEAGSSSIMASYNALNSIPSGLNQWLLQDMLRGYLGFTGFVVTDYSLVGVARNLHKVSNDLKTIAVRAVKAGLNREIPSFLGNEGYKYLLEAIECGLIEEKDIDKLVLDVLKVKFAKGLFDEDLMLSPGYAKKVTRNRNHIELAYEASQKSIVMLKNDGTLPLDESERIAVLGSLAKHPKLGGYSTWEIEVNSLIDTMINADYIEANGVSVEQKFSLIESEFFKSMSEDGIIPGITGFYKDNKVFCFEPVIIRNDGCINFDWSESPAAEHEKFQVGKEFSVEWRGLIEVPKSGQYTFCIEANGGIKLEIDSELLIDRFFDTVSDRQMAMYYLERGKHYPIVVGFSTSGSSPKIKFTWDYSENQDQRIPDNQQILKNYRTVVIVARVTEGEGSDRSNLDLTQSMEKLICDVAEIRKKVIVVIYAGSAVTMMKWQDKVSGIFHVWYLGEAGGKAIADVLYSRYNPAGRLPITFPQHVAQIPLCYNEEPRGRNSGYNDITDKLLYPFGFGLSYSTFVYDNVLLEKSYISIGESTSLKVNVTNIGKMDGDEVIQLYIHDVFSSVATPKLELKDFKRVHIKRGETKTVEFLLTPKMLQLLGEDLIWVIEHRHSKLLNIGLK